MNRKITTHMAALGVAAILALAASGALASGERAAEERNRETVRAAFAAWADGGNVFESLLADDVVWIIHGSDPAAGTYNGRRAVIEDAAGPLTSRLATPVVPETHAIIADGDTVVVRFDGSATTTSGAPYRNRFVWIFAMRDDKVVRTEAFLDLTAYREAVKTNTPRSDAPR